MKKITLAVLTLMLVFSGSAFAQGKYGKDSAECIKYLSSYKEYFKQKVAEVNKKMPSYKTVGHIKIRSTEFVKNTSKKITRFNIDKTID